jgi:hypothetical protein
MLSLGKPSLLFLFSLAFVSPALADPAPDKTDPKDRKAAHGSFVRIQRNAEKQPVAFQTAIVRYAPVDKDKDVTVDLVAVVHIGDRAYYDQLNKELDKYDVVLFELVAPPGTRVPKGGKRDKGNPLHMIQNIMKTMLGLEFQLEHIDYTKKHFVHADLSPDEMVKAMKERGESGLTLALGVLTDILRQQNAMALKKDKGPAEDVNPLALLLDPQAGLKLRRLLADQLEAMDTGTGLGPTINNLLIVDRNKAALKVLRKEIDGGKKKIAIFYGAGHMPDFEQRLLADFGLRRQNVSWLRAWDLQAGGGGGVLELLKLLD